MSTEKQAKANRQNAQKSTGPLTAEGKATVSQNAIKHGLFAAKTVIKGENPADYELFRDEMLAELTPAGMLESVLAERIVSLSWRLQRAVRMHNEAVDVMLARNETNAFEKDAPEDTGEVQDPLSGGLESLLGRATYDDFSNSRVLERLWIYERRIEYSLISTINKLQHYQFIQQIHESETRKAKPARPSLKSYSEPHLLFSKGLAQYLRDKVAGRSRKQEKQVDLKKQSQFNRSAFGVQSTARTNLKKQSQFTPAMVSAKPSMKGDYSNNSDGGDEENKANQSQTRTAEQTNGARNRKKIRSDSDSLTG